MNQQVDPVTASVIQGALENIAVEIGYKLMRMSYSSIIRESEDFGAALMDEQGRGLAESAQSTPLQAHPENLAGTRRCGAAWRCDHA
jgi:N-methylhydantoinase B